jgi:hypothetical protein
MIIQSSSNSGLGKNMMKRMHAAMDSRLEEPVFCEGLDEIDLDLEVAVQSFKHAVQNKLTASWLDIHGYISMGNNRDFKQQKSDPQLFKQNIDMLLGRYETAKKNLLKVGKVPAVKLE